MPSEEDDATEAAAVATEAAAVATEDAAFATKNAAKSEAHSARSEIIAVETVESAHRISVRAMQMALASLVIVVLVMAVSLAVTLGITRNAQNDADALQRELSCRSEIYRTQEIAASELNASIAQALVALGRDESIDPFVDSMEQEILVLREANARRSEAIELCADLED